MIAHSPPDAVVQRVQNTKVIGDRTLEQPDEGAVSIQAAIEYFQGPIPRTGSAEGIR